MSPRATQQPTMRVTYVASGNTRANPAPGRLRGWLLDQVLARPDLRYCEHLRPGAERAVVLADRLNRASCRRCLVAVELGLPTDQDMRCDACGQDAEVQRYIAAFTPKQLVVLFRLCRIDAAELGVA